jgi:hypothetical protein
MRAVKLFILLAGMLQIACSKQNPYPWKVYSVKSEAFCVNSKIDSSYYEPSYVEFDKSFTPKANTWYKTGTRTIYTNWLTPTTAYIYIKIGPISDRTVGTCKVEDLKEYASPCE